jgi:zinc and cadmium transporter
MDYLLLLSTIVLGVATVLLFPGTHERHIKLLNAFTGAYLLAVTCLHLLPDLFAGVQAHSPAALRLGGLLLAGFFIQILLDSVSMGVEHGHTHGLHGPPYGVILGLCAHAFIEATALGAGPQDQTLGARAVYEHGRHLLLWSIVIHNYPVSIAFVVILIRAGLKRASMLGWLTLFAAMAPLALLLSNHSRIGAYAPELMAVVVGIFLHVSTTILFEVEEGHRIHLRKALAVLAGLGAGVLTVGFH